MKAISSVQVENDRVRIREWRFAPSTETGWHRHEYDFVVVPQTSGRLRLRTKENESHVDLVEGCAYTRPAGVEHNVYNMGKEEIVLIEIDLF